MKLQGKNSNQSVITLSASLFSRAQACREWWCMLVITPTAEMEPEEQAREGCMVNSRLSWDTWIQKTIMYFIKTNSTILILHQKVKTEVKSKWDQNSNNLNISNNTFSLYTNRKMD